MRLTVLVVDDEPLARQGLKLLLGRQSQLESVSEARNGREAIALIREKKLDLVLLDVQMPRTDGFAVVNAVGAERMPLVIFVTAHDQYAVRASMLRPYSRFDPGDARLPTTAALACSRSGRPSLVFGRTSFRFFPSFMAPASLTDDHELKVD